MNWILATRIRVAFSPQVDWDIETFKTQKEASDKGMEFIADTVRDAKKIGVIPQMYVAKIVTSLI